MSEKTYKDELKEIVEKFEKNQESGLRSGDRHLQEGGH